MEFNCGLWGFKTPESKAVRPDFGPAPNPNGGGGTPGYGGVCGPTRMGPGGMDPSQHCGGKLYRGEGGNSVYTGDRRPKDFGINPDKNHDGNVGEMEYKVFKEELRTVRHEEQTALNYQRLAVKEELGILKEQGKNYRGYIQAQATSYQAEMNTKAHKVWGK